MGAGLIPANIGRMRLAFIPHATALGAVVAIALIMRSQPGAAGTVSSGDSIPSETARHVHVAGARRDDAKDALIVTLRIDPGFHINANPASSKYLIPTALNLPGVRPARIDYPPPVYFRPQFADDQIAVYEGTVAITARFAHGTLAHLPLFGSTVTVQACTDAICFPPADLPVAVPKPAAD